MFASSLIALMLGVFVKDSKEGNGNNESGQRPFNFCFWLIFASTIFALLALFNKSAINIEESLFGGHFRNGKFEVLLKAILLFTFLFALLNLRIKKAQNFNSNNPS